MFNIGLGYTFAVIGKQIYPGLSVLFDFEGDGNVLPALPWVPRIKSRQNLI